MKYMPYGISAALAIATTAAAAQAQATPKPFTVSGSFGLVSDYRFRGVSQSDRKLAAQGGVTVAHTSGFYAGTWASNLAGWGTFGGANLELDLIGGYKRSLGGTTVDAGLTWYMYPGGADETDFGEPYLKIGRTIGPVAVVAGIAYAPRQQALGNWSNTPNSRIGNKKDNLYVSGDVSSAVPGTPVTLKAHLGHSNGNPGLGPNGTSLTPTGHYWDWLVGVDYVLSPVTLGIAYVDTDIGKARSAYLQPNFATLSGKSIAGGRLLLTASAAF